jgi:hypothetical protein
MAPEHILPANVLRAVARAAATEFFPRMHRCTICPEFYCLNFGVHSKLQGLPKLRELRKLLRQRRLQCMHRPSSVFTFRISCF